MKSSKVPPLPRIISLGSREISTPSKILLFIHQTIQKKMCKCSNDFALTFLPQAPSQANNYCLTYLATTEVRQKQRRDVHQENNQIGSQIL